jgi:hypothetical protein
MELNKMKLVDKDYILKPGEVEVAYSDTDILAVSDFIFATLRQEEK